MTCPTYTLFHSQLSLTLASASCHLAMLLGAPTFDSLAYLWRTSGVHRDMLLVHDQGRRFKCLYGKAQPAALSRHALNCGNSRTGRARRQALLIQRPL
jgi:hypothetical protein